METIGKIRRWHRVDKLSVSAIARRLSASRNTIAKYLEGEVTHPRYKTRPKRAPVLGAWVAKLEALLAADAPRSRKEQRTAKRLHDALLQEGFTGSYPTVQRFVKAWHVPGARKNPTALIATIAASPAGSMAENDGVLPPSAADGMPQGRFIVE